MFSVTRRPDALEQLELRDNDGGSLALLAPSRGGMLTRLALGKQHLFFLDEKTLRDPQANVRGGNPVLFPSPGKLAGDHWSRDGKQGELKQHGFARQLAWDIISTGTDEGASATLGLSSNDQTLAQYPWNFDAEYRYLLRGLVLRIEMRFTNRALTPMPFGAGFHPYFHVRQSEKGSTRIQTSATRAFDNAAQQNIALPRIDLTAPEVDLHLIDHGSSTCVVTTPRATIALRGSSEFTHWVVWTLAGKDFVCVEPWTSPGNALNTGEHLLFLSPGETRTLSLEIERVA